MQARNLTNNGSNFQNAGSVSANKTSTSAPSVVSAMSRYNQRIESLYSSLVVNALENMKNSEQQGQFSFVIFGNEKQDDLETSKKIKISEIKKTNPDIANKILQFARESQANRKGTDYEFSIKEDKNGDIEIPYIAIIDIADKAVDNLSKDKAVNLLQNVSESLSQTRTEEQEKSKQNGWISFVAGLITSGMTAVGLIVPNVVSNMTESLAQGLKITGFVGLGLTAGFVLFGVITKFMKAMKKNSIDTQKDTIDRLLKNSKEKVDEIKMQHNQELASITADIAKKTAGKAVGNVLSNLQQSRQTNNKSSSEENIANTENINTHKSKSIPNVTSSVVKKMPNITTGISNNREQRYWPIGSGISRHDNRVDNSGKNINKNNNSIQKLPLEVLNEENKYNKATAQLKQEEEKLLKLFNKNYDNNKKSNGNLQSNDINNGEKNTIIKGEQKNIVANNQNNGHEKKKAVPQQKSGLDFLKVLMQMSRANKANVNNQTEPNKNINSNVANNIVSSGAVEKNAPAVSTNGSGENIIPNTNVGISEDVVVNNNMIVDRNNEEGETEDLSNNEEQNEEENEDNIEENKNTNNSQAPQGMNALKAFINMKEAKEANLAHKEKNGVNNVSHNAMSPGGEYNKGQKKILNSVNQNLIGVSTNTANGIK